MATGSYNFGCSIINGSLWFFSPSDPTPSSPGGVGSVTLNTTTGEIFQKQLDGSWTSQGFFPGISKSYWQATQTSAQVGIGSDVDLVVSQNKNVGTGVYTLSGSELTIDKSGNFKFDINVTAITGSGAREELCARIQRQVGGVGPFSDIPTSEGHGFGYSYHRNNEAGRATMDISTMLTVTSGDVFKIVLNSSTVDVDTIPEGTGWIVEEL